MRKECLVECIIKYYRCFSMLRYQGVFIVQYACKLSSTKDSPYFCIETSVHISETCISQCLMTSSLCNMPANHAIPDYVTFDCDESVLVRSVQTLAGRCNWLPVTTFTTCQLKSACQYDRCCVSPWDRHILYDEYWRDIIA